MSGPLIQKSTFFSSQNEAMLDRLLYSDFQRRIGGDLTDKQKERLVKTVRHYMGEVYENLGEKPVAQLNKDVLAATVPDFLSYMRRSTINQAGPEDRIRSDVSARFGELQTERQDVRAQAPEPPDFRIPLDENAGSALSLFEQVKKQREADAARELAEGGVVEETVTTMVTVTKPNAFVESADRFKQEFDASRRNDELALSQRNAARTAAAPRNTMLAMPPDPRELYFGKSSSGLRSEGSGLGQTNPTVALPQVPRFMPSLAQDVIKKQDDIVSYRENEFNLFLYSSDRNWVTNSTENRYNFSVNFDPANNRSGFGFSTAANIKFKNIVRIELVKTIVPTEGIDILATKSSPTAYDTDININVLSFPYLMLRIPELDTNNFGTNNNLDNSFGIIQYDANWISDNTANNRGYLAMIPKFMKCMKVYHPTPLATLQKLTIELNRPDGTSVSPTLDTLDVSGFLFSSQLHSFPSGSVTPNNHYYDSSGSYIWIQTKTWFNKFSMSQGDRIQFKNVVFPSSFTQNVAQADFLQFIQRPYGHIIVDVGKFQEPHNVYGYTTGGNIQGYCNYVIIRNNYVDPTTGSESLALWGANEEVSSAFVDEIPGAAMVSGRFINLNHQTQVVLRIITRDMDSAARLRPDNM
jgi:hypothetical protein